MKPFVTTYTGEKIHFLNPDPKTIRLPDIAHSLSQLCRFVGHTIDLYSVAQHSVLVSRLVPPAFAMWGLLHDASEAILSDISSGVKAELLDYKSLEEIMMRAVALRFRLDWPMPGAVDVVDKRIAHDEALQFFRQPPDWADPDYALGVKIKAWSPRKAEAMFLARYLGLFSA